MRYRRLPPQVYTALDGLFDAAVFPFMWPVALDRLARSLGAAGGIIIPREPDLIELGFPTSRTLTEVMARFVGEGWHRKDIRADRGWPLLAKVKPVIIEHDLVTDDEHGRMPYFQELFGAFDLPWFAGVGFRVSGRQWCLTLIRGAGQGPYTLDDVASFDTLPRYLSRIVTLALSVRAAIETPIVSTVELLGENVIAVDQSGAVKLIGNGAATLLGDDLIVRRNRLLAAEPSDNLALQALISRAVSATSPAEQLASSAIGVSRRRGRPLLVQALRLPRLAQDVFSRLAALILLRDLDNELRADPAVLVRVLGLSPAEARIASAIGSGLSPRTAAEAAGVSEETVRTQLKIVYGKLNVARQNELAALVAKLASPRAGSGTA